MTRQLPKFDKHFILMATYIDSGNTKQTLNKILNIKYPFEREDKLLQLYDRACGIS